MGFPHVNAGRYARLARGDARRDARVQLGNPRISFDAGANWREAIAKLAPAEAATDVDHPNLAAWRAVQAAGGREIVAVFVGDVGDPPAGPADSALRAQF